jgi:hypothetical protein
LGATIGNPSPALFQFTSIHSSISCFVDLCNRRGHSDETFNVSQTCPMSIRISSDGTLFPPNNPPRCLSKGLTVGWLRALPSSDSAGRMTRREERVIPWSSVKATCPFKGLSWGFRFGERKDRIGH